MPWHAAGFTLIELLVTLTVLVVAMAIAIPNLREFAVRNEMAGIANEFSASVAQARSTAVSQNSCVTMCQSTNTQNAISGGAVSCATAGLDWQRGWMIFVNPTCSTAQNTATEVLRVVQPLNPGYEILNVGGASRKLMFDGRGLLSLGTSANLTLAPTNTSDTVAMNNRRQICISSTGRVTIRKYEGGSCT